MKFIIGNMSKTVDKKIQSQSSIWSTLKKATTKNSEWPDKVSENNISNWVFYLPTYVEIQILIKLNDLRMNFLMSFIGQDKS